MKEKRKKDKDTKKRLKSLKRPDKMERLKAKEEKIQNKMAVLQAAEAVKKRKKIKRRYNMAVKAAIILPAVYSRRKVWMKMLGNVPLFKKA